jgi:methyl-accepting chemotaxis protein
MVSGMMSGVADSLGRVTTTFQTYEQGVDGVYHASESLADEMRSLVDLAQQVDRVLALIEHLALQTRVLSLNATLEAARAGDTGRGFAVVAASVKDLARQTNGATGDIRDALSGILCAAENATGHSTELSRSIVVVREMTRVIVRQLLEQAQVSVAAARNVDQTAAGVDAIAERLGQVARAYEFEAEAIVACVAEAGSTQLEGETSCH